MIYKISTDKTTVCIGSFTSEVAGQFSYSNGKSAVYAFNIHGATDEGLSIANIVTGKAVVVPFAERNQDQGSEWRRCYNAKVRQPES